jgi:uncharacterized surface protein with fasciclin (FAS1) repeats
MEGKTGMIVGVVAVVALFVGGILIFSGGDDTTETEETTTPATSQTETQTTEPEEEAVAESNIVELAQGTESLSTLVAAVVQADLVETLSGDGPFTVFAPTDDAFAALLAELNVTAEELLAREDLSAILTYHVVAGEAMAADLTDGQELTTVQGGTLTVGVTDAGVTLTDANGNVVTVAQADVKASNGIVHVIDGVLLPRS